LIRAIVDTNILISGVIRPEGVAGTIQGRLRDGDFMLLYSEPLLVELTDVLNRSRIRQKYRLGSEDIETVLALILLRGEPIDPRRRVEICRDPKDNMILEAAVAAGTRPALRIHA